jgi:predicted RNA binding protein YcfA (HicA-like mRNA interferase family)
MVSLKTGQIVPIPIHSKEVGVGLIREIIRQLGISRDEWLEL